MPDAINKRFSIIKRIAEGGMGRVYLVSDEASEGRKIALKTLLKERLSASTQGAFEKEFELLAGLRHPNIEEVYDYGVVEEGPQKDLGAYFYTCEYLEGSTLREATQGRCWEEIEGMLVQLLRALQFIHAHGLVHYDVKPENVLVTRPKTQSPGSRSQGSRLEAAAADEASGIGVPESCVRLIDFGLAGARRASPGLPVKGSLPYVAPEVVRQDVADHRVDLYSLGVTLYEILTGELPFGGESSKTILGAHLWQPVPPLRTSGREIPEDIEDLITHLMAKVPSERPASANEVIRWLNRMSGRNYALETKETLKGYVGSGAFVGRDEEMKCLKGMWERVQAGQRGARLAVVRGEAGIGKSRLVEEFRIWAQLKGVPVFSGKAPEAASDVFGALSEAMKKFIREVELREHTGIVEAGLVEKYGGYLRFVVPGLSQRYHPSDPASVEPTQERERLLDRVSEFILTSARPKAMVLIVEDVQWADDMSVGLVEFLARKGGLGVEDGKAMLIVTLEETDSSEKAGDVLTRLIGQGYAQERKLEALGKGAQEELIRSMFGQGSEQIAGKILGVENSGNPLFLEEVLRDWVERGILRWRDWGWEVDAKNFEVTQVPGRVEEIIESRLGRLGEHEKRWLEGLAVWGAPATNEELSASLGIDAVGIEGLEARGLVRRLPIEEGLAYRFAHDCIRERVRRGIADESWSRMNARVLEWLEREAATGARKRQDEVHRLARLAWEAGLSDAFLRYAEEAARQCEDRHAVGDALDLYEKLLKAGLTKEKQAEIGEKVGDLSTILGCVEKAEEAYRALLEDLENIANERGGDKGPGTRVALTRLARKMGGVVRLRGAIGEAGEWHRRALGECLAEGGGVEHAMEEALTYLEIAILEVEQSRWQEGENFLARARRVADGLGGKGLPILANVERILGNISRLRGEFEASLRHFEYALEYYRRKGDSYQEAATVGSMGNVYEDRGEFERALEFYRRHLELSERMGYRLGVAAALGNMGIVYRQKGDFERALECHERQLRMSEETGRRSQMAVCLGNIGIIYRQKGQLDRALEFQRKCLEMSEELGDRGGVARACGNMGNIYFNKGDLDRALECHERHRMLSEEIGDRVGAARALFNSGNVYFVRGELDRALECFGRHLEVNEAIGNRAGVRLALGNMGNVYHAKGELARAAECFRSALRISKDIDSRLGMVVSLNQIGGLCASRGDIERGIALGRRGRMTADELGDTEERVFARETLSILHRRRGEIEKALRYASEAIEIARGAGMPADEARARLVLAEALVEFQRTGSKDISSISSFLPPPGKAETRSHSMRDRMPTDEALEQVAQASELFKLSHGFRNERVDIVRARALLTAGDVREALWAAERALRATQERPYAESRVEALEIGGLAFLACGQCEEGMRLLREALSLASTHALKPLMEDISRDVQHARRMQHMPPGDGVSSEESSKAPGGSKIEERRRPELENRSDLSNFLRELSIKDPQAQEMLTDAIISLDMADLARCTTHLETTVQRLQTIGGTSEELWRLHWVLANLYCEQADLTRAAGHSIKATRMRGSIPQRET